MRIDFTKMHGVGNDFVVFDAPADASLLEPGLVRALADRRTGIGFDQALILEKTRRADTGVLPLDSPAGGVRARIDGTDVAVDMGAPDFDPRSLPFEAQPAADSYSLEVAGRTLAIGAVSMGNPHAVLTVDSVEAAPVETLGPQIERHPRFPKRVNAGFLEIVDRAQVRLRVWERGAGETRSCGTGACAAVAVARRRGLLEAEVRVSVRGGELRVNWGGRGGRG